MADTSTNVEVFRGNTVKPNSSGYLRIEELTRNLAPDDPQQAEVIKALHSFDHDGDGTISVHELIKVGERRVLNEKKIQNLRRIVLVTFVGALVFSGVMLALMIAANEASKDDKPDDDGTLKTISGEYVSTSETQSAVYLKELASVNPRELVNMRHVYLQVDTLQASGVWRLYTVTGYDSISSSHIEIFTARGDIIQVMNQEVVILTENAKTGATETLKVVSSRRRSLLGTEEDTVTISGGYDDTPWDMPGTLNVPSSELDSDSDTDTEIHCPGYAEYCDCGGDCHNHPEWCSCPDAQACCASAMARDSDTDSDTDTEIHCPGYDEHCDCGGDCHNHPEWCSCPDAQACCASDGI